MTVKEMILDALSKFLTTLRSEIVDNLTSTSTTKPLSANQGKVLADMNEAGSYYTYVNLTANGLNIKAYVPKANKNILAVSVQGTTTALLPTSSGYYNLFTLDTIASNITYSHIAYQPINQSVISQIVLDSSGVFKIGYTRNLSGTSVDISSGSAVRIEHVFFLS